MIGALECNLWTGVCRPNGDVMVVRGKAKEGGVNMWWALAPFFTRSRQNLKSTYKPTTTYRLPKQRLPTKLHIRWMAARGGGAESSVD